MNATPRTAEILTTESLIEEMERKAADLQSDINLIEAEEAFLEARMEALINAAEEAGTPLPREW